MTVPPSGSHHPHLPDPGAARSHTGPDRDPGEPAWSADGPPPGWASAPAPVGGPGRGPGQQGHVWPVPKPPRRVDWLRIAWLGGVITFIALCGIGLLAYVGYQIGPLALGIGFAAAVLPVPLLVLAFLWLDRYEPEPVKYLAFVFLWGAFVATGAALLVNTGGGVVLRWLGLPDALTAVWVAPFIEEIMKALGPVLLFVVRRRAFSGMVDGIVYCGLSAIGFAMVENILYLGGVGYASNADEGGPSAGIRGLILVFVGRIVFTGFAHPLFTAMTGIGLGIAARTRDRRVRWMAPLCGLLAAMALHATFNLLATMATEVQGVVLYGYFSVLMPIFLTMLGFALWVRGHEARLTQRMLPYYVRAGWLSPPEVASLATVGRRLSARVWAKRVSGDAGAAAMRGYQFAATQLALLRERIERGLVTAPAFGVAGEERRLLDAISGYRAAYVGRDPFVPRARWDGRRYHVTFPDGTARDLPPPPDPVVPVPVAQAAAPPGYPAPPGHPLPPGHGSPPGYPLPPGYPIPPGYPLPPGHGSPPGYPLPPGYGAPPAGYGPPPSGGHSGPHGPGGSQPQG